MTALMPQILSLCAGRGDVGPGSPWPTRVWHDGAMTALPHPTVAKTHPRTLITVAPTGAESAKADVPALPTTLEELVETAVRCEAAGAAMIHLHIRAVDHRPTLDVGRLSDFVAAVREKT